MTGRYLEDFAVGQIFRSGPLPVDEERIKTFAAEFDPQPFHLDENAARDTIFDGLAACTRTTPKGLLSTVKSRPRQNTTERSNGRGLTAGSAHSDED